MQGFLAARRIRFLLECLPQGIIRRHLSHAHGMAQGTKIQPGTAYKKGLFATLEDFLRYGFRRLLVLGNAVVFPWIRHIQHVMRNAVHLRHRGLSRADVHATINLHGIHADDFTLKSFGQANG